MKALLFVISVIAVAHFITLIVIGRTLEQIEKHLKDKQNELNND